MTDAAITVDDRDEVLTAPLRWVAGRTWTHPEAWAVLIDGQPVDLTAPGWSARAQARPRPGPAGGAVLAEWTSQNPGPSAGSVLVGSATVVLPGRELVTSTVQLHHSPAVSAAWGEFSGWFDCEVVHTVDGTIVDRYAIARGAVWAMPAVAP